MMQPLQSGGTSMLGLNAPSPRQEANSDGLSLAAVTASAPQIPSRDPPTSGVLSTPSPQDDSDEKPILSKDDIKVLQVKKLLESLRKKGIGDAPSTQLEKARKTLRDLNQSADAREVSLAQPIVLPNASTSPQRMMVHVSGNTIVEVEVREVSRTQAEVQIESADPLVFDLDGDGIELTSVEDGVMFDIRGSGHTVQTSFVDRDDALLVLDKNGNGVVDGGKELFGDQNGSANGYAELAKYDENRDGVITPEDSVYERLRLFRDGNRDGKSVRSELYTLRSKGIVSIDLNYRQLDKVYNQGNAIAQSAQYTREDGGTGGTADVMLRYLNVEG